MDITITTIGALIGLAVAIILIIKKNRTCVQYDSRCFCRWSDWRGRTCGNCYNLYSSVRKRP